MKDSIKQALDKASHELHQAIDSESASLSVHDGVLAALWAAVNRVEDAIYNQKDCQYIEDDPHCTVCDVPVPEWNFEFGWPRCAKHEANFTPPVIPPKLDGVNLNMLDRLAPIGDMIQLSLELSQYIRREALAMIAQDSSYEDKESILEALIDNLSKVPDARSTSAKALDDFDALVREYGLQKVKRVVKRFLH